MRNCDIFLEEKLEVVRMTEHNVLNFSVRSVSKLTNTLMSTRFFQGFPLLRCLTQLNCIRQLTKHNQKAHKTKVPMQESCRARIQTIFLSTILGQKKGTSIHTEYTVQNNFKHVVVVDGGGRGLTDL